MTKEKEFIRTELGISGDWVGDGDVSVDRLADVLAKWHRRQAAHPATPGQPDWAALEGKGLDTKLTHWEQPAPPVTLPTDEEIRAKAEFDYPRELTNLMLEMWHRKEGFTFGARWAVAEIEKRMKGGEG